MNYELDVVEYMNFYKQREKQNKTWSWSNLKHDFKMHRVRDTQFIAYNEKSDFEGLHFYDLIEDVKPNLFLEIDPKVLDFKETPLCMPVPKHISIKNTHPTDILEIRSIFSETDILDVKDTNKNIWIEPG